MEKIISTRDFADIKRMAQIVNPKVSRKTTLLKQKAKIDAEIAELNEAISLLEGGIKCKFLGLGTEQLVRKVVTPAVREDGTPVLDAKTGKQLTKTTWEPLDCLVYNAEKNNYTLTIEEEEDLEEPPMTEKGNDFDADAEKAEESSVETPTSEITDNPFNF